MTELKYRFMLTRLDFVSVPSSLNALGPVPYPFNWNPYTFHLGDTCNSTSTVHSLPLFARLIMMIATRFTPGRCFFNYRLIFSLRGNASWKRVVVRPIGAIINIHTMRGDIVPIDFNNRENGTIIGSICSRII